MNPLTNVRNTQALNDRELELGLTGTKTSWHTKFKDSAWVFIGGLPYDLTEGDVICVLSQYGEVVNLNLVRDQKTGKSKGFCFLCYEDQRSTILAVDNLNGTKILGRVIRVDHCDNYKMPKDTGDEDEMTKKLREHGVAPKPLKVTDSEEEEEEEEEEDYQVPVKKMKKEKKKKKKEKKHKKKKKKVQSTSESSSESSSESDCNDSHNKRKYRQVSPVETKRDREDSLWRRHSGGKVKTGSKGREVIRGQEWERERDGGKERERYREWEVTREKHSDREYKDRTGEEGIGHERHRRVDSEDTRGYREGKHEERRKDKYDRDRSRDDRGIDHGYSDGYSEKLSHRHRDRR